MLDHARQQRAACWEVYYDYCETEQVKPPPRGSERASSLLRRPPWSEYLQLHTKGSTVTANAPKLVYVPDDGEFEAAMGQITHGGAMARLAAAFCSTDGSGICIISRKKTATRSRKRNCRSCDTPGVPDIDMTLHDWEEMLVLTNDQSKGGLKDLWAR